MRPVAQGTWCSGITSALHAEGPGSIPSVSMHSMLHAPWLLCRILEHLMSSLLFAGEELLRARAFCFTFSLGFALVRTECVWFVWWVLCVLFVFGWSFFSVHWPY